MGIEKDLTASRNKTPSTANFFKEYTEAYERIMSRTGLSVYGMLLKLHIRVLDGRKKVLDSGCGPGNLATELLLYQNCEVYALYQNDAALERLKNKAHEHASRLHTYCQDAHTLPFESDFFDGVSSQLVLPFMERPMDYLQEHKRVLKKGGIFAVSGPSEGAKKDVNWMMRMWRQDLIDQGLWDKLGNDWELMERYTRENVKSNVQNWFSLEEISRILSQNLDMRIVGEIPNPMYYSMGYFVAAEKK